MRPGSPIAVFLLSGFITAAPVHAELLRHGAVLVEAEQES